MEDTPIETVNIQKHSALIQLGGAKLTLVQRKAFTGLLFVARAQKAVSPDSTIFKISYKELKDLCNIKTPNNSTLNDQLFDLLHIVVVPNFLNKDKNSSWTAFNLLAGMDYNANDGMLTFSFPHQILENLVSPRMYGLLNISSFQKLKNKYAVTLYELISDYKSVSFPKISVSQLRSVLGVEEDKYLEFKSLNRSVISKAVKEINEKTDFTVKTILTKNYGGVESITFDIKTNSVIEKNEESQREITEDVIKAVKKLSGSKGDGYVHKLINNYMDGDPGTIYIIENTLQKMQDEERYERYRSKVGKEFLVNGIYDYKVVSMYHDKENDMYRYIIENIENHSRLDKPADDLYEFL